METLTKIDLANVAKNLELPADKVSSAVELLEAGNTIPFLTRYRKDATGGLGERQLRDIKQEVARQTALAQIGVRPSSKRAISSSPTVCPMS